MKGNVGKTTAEATRTTTQPAASTTIGGRYGVPNAITRAL